MNNDELKPPELLIAEKEFQQYISKINEYTLTKYAQNIYIRKQVRYYDNDSIFIVKPNQKRFWIRSQAIYDAGTIINELAVMKNDKQEY